MDSVSPGAKPRAVSPTVSPGLPTIADRLATPTPCATTACALAFFVLPRCCAVICMLPAALAWVGKDRLTLRNPDLSALTVRLGPAPLATLTSTLDPASNPG